MVNALYTTTNAVVTALVGINAIALVMLAGEAMSEYLKTEELALNSKVTSKEASRNSGNGSRIRLQLMRLITWMLAVIGVFQVVLPSDLADSVTSAWFVGQGFSLQQSLQSLVAGIVLRYEKLVRDVIVHGKGTVTMSNTKYTMHACSMVSITLKQQEGDTYIVVPWNALYDTALQPD